MVFQELVVDVDESNYNNFLDNDLAVLNFFSDWHMNCLMALPIIEEIASEFFEKHGVCFGKVNIDEAEEIARKHKVSNIPTILFFRQGEQIDKLEVIQEDLLRDKLRSILGICI
jgi:thioredoxin 1